MQSELSVPLGNAEAWLDEHVRQLATYDLHPIAEGAGRAEFETEYGHIRIAANVDRIRVEIDAADENGLTVLQGSVSEYLIGADPALAETISWSGTAPSTGRPKNFREMRVVRTEALSDWLLRMTLQGEELQPFTERGLHVRLMIPSNPGRERIVWPTVQRSGAVRYPEGEDELTVRVYTIRRIFADRGEVEIDIVRHAGGAFSDWAETARPGDRVGMIGPGGGHYPADGWLAIGGDDTALPAILRILDARDSSEGGRVIFGLRPGQAALDVTPPENFSLDWVPLDDLPAAMKAATPPAGAAHVAWFAGEAEQAREMRRHFKSVLQLPAGMRTSAVYWHRAETCPSP